MLFFVHKITSSQYRRSDEQQEIDTESIFFYFPVCNVTIISSEMKEKSGKSFGQIKSPSLQGPDACTYTFIPDKTERVELQIYRVVNVGRHNGTM